MRRLRLLFVFCCGAAAAAMGIPPKNAPVARLAKNVGAYIKEHPKDPQGYYVLGRIHSLCFMKQSSALSYYPGDLPNLDATWLDPWNDERRPGDLTDRVFLRTHLRDAIVNLRRAIKLSPENGLYRVGLASLLEAALRADLLPPTELLGGSKLSKEKESELEVAMKRLGDASAAVREEGRRVLRASGDDAASLLERHADDKDAEVRRAVHDLLVERWKEHALEGDLEAYDLSIGKDMRDLPERPIQDLREIVSYDAGMGYLRLVDKRNASKDEAKKIEEIEAKLKTIKHKARRFVTPILFPLDRARPLETLLDPTNVVRFDLDGDLYAEKRPWIRPDTALLVWDPKEKGRITSGRDLFGSVSWWMFWRDGYHALDALDDDRDGRLSGDELIGLAVWRDANGNGVSDPGEVVPVQRLGIVSLSARATGTFSDCPGNPRGVTFADGRVLPTYDWVAGAPGP